MLSSDWLDCIGFWRRRENYSQKGHCLRILVIFWKRNELATLLLCRLTDTPGGEHMAVTDDVAEGWQSCRKAIQNWALEPPFDENKIESAMHHSHHFQDENKIDCPPWPATYTPGKLKTVAINKDTTRSRVLNWAQALQTTNTTGVSSKPCHGPQLSPSWGGHNLASYYLCWDSTLFFYYWITMSFCLLPQMDTSTRYWLQATQQPKTFGKEQLKTLV